MSDPAPSSGAPAAAAVVADGAELSVDAKLELITRNLQEVMGDEVAIAKLRAIIEKRPLKLYWGTATTGAPHIAYFVPMSKLADFLRAGCEVTILLADLHAYLDNLKAPWELLKQRTDYYEQIISQMLLAIGVPISKLRFVRGRTYQLTERFTLDLYKLTTITTERNAKKAGAEVVKQSESPCLSGMLYPLLQALDEEYLECDAQFGGVDQRKIFTLAERCLPALGYTKRVHLMNPMVPGLAGAKMSSSEKSSKIDLLDSAESIAAKLKDAFCPEAVVEGNGVLAFVKMVLFAVSGVAGRKQGFTVRRPEKFGGDSHYASYAELEAAYVAKQVFPLDLKDSVAAALNELLQPIRQHFTSQEMKELVARAYPKEDAAGAAGGEAVILDDEDDPAVAAASAAAASSAAAAAAAAAAPAAKGGKAGAKGGKSASAAAAAAPAGPVADPNAPMDIARLDIKVGRVVKAENHPRADKLYLSSVDCGDASGPRQVVSGLKAHIALEALQGRLVAVLTNLKPTSLVGVKSHAMILAAANADGTTVELVDVPEGAQVGERVQFAGFPTDASLPELAKANENTLSKVLPELKTDAQGNVQWKGVDARTSAGKLAVKSLFNVQVK